MLNLQSYLQSLSASPTSLNVKHGFIHPEPSGIKAIDQKGGEGSLMETRLYVYPEDEAQVLHVLSIGTKQDQGRDIQECIEYVKSLRKMREDEKHE